MILITLDQFRVAFPKAKIGHLVKVFPYINPAMVEFEINTPKRVKFFLAQIGHESGNFAYISEIASGKAYEMRSDLGNLTKEAITAAHAKGTTTGRFYKGRAWLMITGYYNYKACGDALGIDLVNHPELAAEYINATRISAWWWKANGCNKFCDSDDFKGLTKKINGGYNGFNDRKIHLANVTGALVNV